MEIMPAASKILPDDLQARTTTPVAKLCMNRVLSEAAVHIRCRGSLQLQTQGTAGSRETPDAILYYRGQIHLHDRDFEDLPVTIPRTDHAP